MKSFKVIILSAVLVPLTLAKDERPPTSETSRIIQAETDRLLYKASMAEFQRELASPSHWSVLDWRNNGCTSAPNRPFGYNFLPSCQRHDFCYLNYRKQGRYDELKASCDDNFQKDMYRECDMYSGDRSKHCKTVATAYHWAVSKFGDDYDMYQLPTEITEVLQASETADGS